MPPGEKRRKPMSKRMLTMSVAAMLAAGVATASSVASAMPFADALAIRKAAGTDVEMVWGRGFGWGFGAGFLGGAILGGALAAPYYYGPYGPAYYPPAYGPGYYPAPAGDPSYCARRYRSYDPATGTYLGYDGVRHPCP
jgi:BA14K-like protein